MTISYIVIHQSVYMLIYNYNPIFLLFDETVVISLSFFVTESPAHKPSSASTSADSISTSKTRLKSSADAEFGSSKPGLKRSFSSPNIAKMVMDESLPTPPVAPAAAPKPTFDRSTKPSER